MNKEAICQLLKKMAIPFEIVNHRAVYNMADVDKIHIAHPEAEAKNLFLRDDKKRNYYLLTVKGDCRVNLKEFRRQQGTRALSFASDTDLEKFLHLKPGAVTPFGLLNDQDKVVQFYLDDYFRKEPNLIGIHPNDNTATIWLKPADLVKALEKYGHQVHIITVD